MPADSPALKVADPVQVLRGIRKQYRGCAFTVRAVRDGEVLVDNGAPGIADMRENGMTVAAWLRPSCVEIIVDDVYRTYQTSAVVAERLHDLRRELAMLLCTFHEPGHIGTAGDCLRSGWISVNEIERLRAIAHITETSNG